MPASAGSRTILREAVESVMIARRRLPVSAVPAVEQLSVVLVIEGKMIRQQEVRTHGAFACAG
jgi:hypothetical protein